jgi:hypothetical protein
MIKWLSANDVSIDFVLTIDLYYLQISIWGKYESFDF